MRVAFFIDFWNFQLTWNDYHRRCGAQGVVRVPWYPQLIDVLIRRVNPAAEYMGTFLYASYDPESLADRRLCTFMNVLAGLPGFTVTLKTRKPIGPVICSHGDCRQPIVTCPHCQQALRRTVEKGIDTALVTDLIRLGLEGFYDRAVLISADSDYVPAVEYLRTKGRLITHVWWRGHAHELRTACWDHILIDNLMPELIPESPAETTEDDGAEEEGVPTENAITVAALS